MNIQNLPQNEDEEDDYSHGLFLTFMASGKAFDNDMSSGWAFPVYL